MRLRNPTKSKASNTSSAGQSDGEAEYEINGHHVDQPVELAMLKLVDAIRQKLA